MLEFKDTEGNDIEVYLEFNKGELTCMNGLKLKRLMMKPMQ